MIKQPNNENKREAPPGFGFNQTIVTLATPVMFFIFYRKLYFGQNIFRIVFAMVGKFFKKQIENVILFNYKKNTAGKTEWKFKKHPGEKWYGFTD